ncbi:hypothetical protein BGZ76_004463 [Entomortierella beljakovae]|nr:hypothetical protein BGZ76_004463 [Entomortierella beljakovae]
MASSNSRLGPGGVSGLASSLRSASNSGPTRAQYHQNNMDSIVPDSDDSTEEDEEYTSYIHDQEQLRKNETQSNQKSANNSALSVRQLLREDERSHDSQDMDIDTNIRLLQARQNEILEDDEELEDDEDEDEEMDDDDGSETLSLTEDDIDFNLVYAFHTFVATQEGQASVVRNDALMLLEDVNVYWWLVRVLKTGVIGYIPAENIETPFERLARLNKYRNVGLSAPTPEWGTFDEPIRPLTPNTIAGRNANRRSVIFNPQDEYFGASDHEWDSDEFDEDDEIGEYYEKDEDAHEGDQENDQTKSELQLEAEKVEQEIMDELRQRENQQHTDSRQKQQQQQQQQQNKLDYGMEESSSDDYEEDDEEVIITNRHRKPLLDDDELIFNDEPRKISLTPTIAQDDVSASRLQTSQGKAKKLRISDDDPSRSSSLRSGQRANDGSTAQQNNSHSSNIHRTASADSEDERIHKQVQERKESKLAALLGEDDRSKGNVEPVETVKKTGKFKSLFGVGKSSKDKEKERKEKERQEKERSRSSNAKGPSSAGNNGGSANSGENTVSRTRTNSSGSVDIEGVTSNSSGPLSPTSQSDSGDAAQAEIVALRVYPGNVDFGASMYKTVVVNPNTMASEVANQAVVKFKLATDSVSSTDFFLTVRALDGDETVLLPTDKIMAIYQSLTAHLTTPLPPNHRLSISSVSSMMSINSVSSFTSNPSTPTSPNSVRRIGSGKSDPHQRSIRFLLNKRIRRAGSVSSVPTTPTTPTTPINPLHQDDFFWVKVVCLAQDLPQSMTMINGLGVALDKNDSRALDQMTSGRIEHWLPMHANSNAGDVIFKALDKLEIRAGVVHGVPEHIITSKKSSAPNGIVIEYQIGLRQSQSSSRSKHGDELPLPPQTHLVRCLEDHNLAPVRRSPKADVASMPTTPDYTFYLRKSPKSLQQENDFAQQQKQQQQAPKKVPAPLQAQALLSSNNETPRSPLSPGMTSPVSLRSLRSIDDMNATVEQNTSVPSSPGPLQQSRMAPSSGASGKNSGGLGSPLPVGNDGAIRIPRRTDSVIMGPASPTRSGPQDISSGRPSPTLAQHQHSMMQGSRTPTPDHVGGRARSSSIGQISGPGIRLGQPPSAAPSALPNHTAENDVSRSSTPERPARPERPDRIQRAISPSMTHGPSPLSLASVLLQENGQKHQDNQGETAAKERPDSIAPLSIKKNATQGMDITLNKGVIRSSRLMNSKQYRYSFIPVEGGEEVDISEIIEDILGEDHDVDGSDGSDDEGDIQNLVVKEDTTSSYPPKRSGSNSSGIRNALNAEKDRLELLTNSARGGDTLMKLERVLGAERGSGANKRQEPPISSQRRPDNTPIANAQPRSTGPPTSLRNPKRDSDVEIQVASVASLSVRSTPPLNGEHAPLGSPRTLRPASPFGTMAKPSILQNTVGLNGLGIKSSPLKDSSAVNENSTEVKSLQDSSQRSFSPIPRRLQTPSPATKSGPNSSLPSPRSLSPTTRLAQLNGASSPNGSTTSLNSSGGKEWLLSSDYSTGMQDLLTLVRAGKSTSASSLNSPLLLRSPLIGKDGKIVMLPSAIKASLRNNSNGSGNVSPRSRSPSLSQLQEHLDSQSRQQGKTFSDDNYSNMDKGINNDEQTRMMLVMLNELTLKDVRQECHPDVYDCWKDLDEQLDRVEKELDELLVTVKTSSI